jgi:drug/metabolite transporter (DMT)-like permease
MKQHGLRAGYLFAIASTILWAGNLTLARGITNIITPVTLSFLRWTVAVLAILPFSLKAIRAEREALRRHLPYVALVGFLGVTMFPTVTYMAGRSTTAMNLSLISITFPIFVVIFSLIVWKEKITLNKAAGIVLVMMGVVILVTKGRLSVLRQMKFAPGDALMLLSSITWAVYSMLLRKKPKELSVWALQGSSFIIGLVFLLPFFIVERSMLPWPRFDFRLLLVIFYVGVMASLAAFMSWNKAVEHLGPVKAGMVYYSLPLFSGALAFALLGEAIGLVHLYSALLIVPGIVLANYEFNGLRSK